MVLIHILFFFVLAFTRVRGEVPPPVVSYPAASGSQGAADLIIYPNTARSVVDSSLCDRYEEIFKEIFTCDSTSLQILNISPVLAPSGNRHDAGTTSHRCSLHYL
jgi:hypothetical protein